MGSFLISLKNTLLGGINLLLSYIPDLPQYIMFVFFLYAVYYIFIKGSGKYYMDVLNGYLEAPNEEDSLFIQTGLKMTANRYTFYLYAIALVIFLAFGISGIINGNIRSMLTGLVLALFIVFFFRPKKYLFNSVKSPFQAIIDIMTRGRKNDFDKELFNSISILKNLAIAQEEEPISADRMLEKLMENSKKLKPVYAQMLVIYRSGDKTRALKYFSDAIGTKNAKNFALTLEKLDKINPTELKMQVTSLQEVMVEERFTKGLDKAESKGNIIYALATAVCFICLLNFMFVCVLMDTMEMLGELF